MRVKAILSDVTLVIADLEVQLGSELRSSPTLCALVPAHDQHGPQVVPLNTPDGRPILLNMANAITMADTPTDA